MKIEGLASVRRDRNLTQKELSRRLGMGQPRISNYEKGMSVSRTMAERIAKELKSSVEDIESTEPVITLRLSDLNPEQIAVLTKR